MSQLFSPYRLHHLDLSNRVVMAPMTRSRAINNKPNALIAEYYSQRADAGLIITEGTSPSPNGLGYARIPGIFNDEQVEAWKVVTDAVHANGGKIFVQLMHTGRISHPANLPAGANLLAPSAVGLDETKMWVDEGGLLEIPIPAAMTSEDVEDAIHEHVLAAQNAMRAGFDGVEIHGANGYLIKQFLNPHTNRRTDAYGGSIENRSRFLLEIVEKVSNAIGSDKVGVRVSPYSTFNETKAYDHTDELYRYIARELNKLNIAYLHVIDVAAKGQPFALLKELRGIFSNTIIASGGFNREKADAIIDAGIADLVAFGRPFLSNPDLVHRLKFNLPYNQPKYDLFYTAGAEGYTDYPVFQEVSVV